MNINVIKKLENYCRNNGLKLTPPRRYVLEIVAKANTPVTAYDVLDTLGQKLDKPNPPTAYRALDFLSAHGFIHRIESLNAYIVCDADHKHSGSQFIICENCNRAFEAHLCSLPSALKTQASDIGFSVTHWNVEIHGTCADCAKL